MCAWSSRRPGLYRHWQLADNETSPVRALLARAARLASEVSLGRGDAGHLAALDEVSLQLATQGLGAAWPLGSSLHHYRQQWESHVRRESCPEGVCLERHAAPCHSTCPANIDIPSFMTHLGHGDYRATIEVIRRDNPLPLVCGLVCPAPCESACVRGGSNGALFIRPLKATAAMDCLADGGYPRPALAPDTGKRIGIIGSGPAGLTAAYYLRTYGHQVEIFEAQDKAGGMLRYGIPAYRLPLDLLDQELGQITALGIAIRTSAAIDSLNTFRTNYDAVFLGLGTQRSRLIPIDGVHRPFVLGGIDFLRSVRSGEDVHVGPRVTVIGGGNVAIDVALTALRQGGQHVDMVSLEKRRDMTASPHEIENAVGEGVQLHPGWGPVRIDEDGQVSFQLCERTLDDNGRFDPQFDANRRLTLEADHVILATGQGTDLAVLDGSGVENIHGFIVADPKTLMTDVPGVFAGGDAEHGPETAVEAIRSGKIAAAAIDAWLRAEPLDPAVGQPVRRADVIPLRVSRARPHVPAPGGDARTQRRRGPRGGELRPDRGGPHRHDGPRRGPSLPALRRVHRLRPVHGRLQRDGRRSIAHGRHHRHPTCLLRLHPGCGPVHRLRRLHPGVPDRGHPLRRPRRRAAHGHHRDHRVPTAAADVQPMRSAHPDAQTPGLHPAPPARPHGGPARSRAVPVVRPPASRPPRRERSVHPTVRLISHRVPPQHIADAQQRGPDDIKVVVDFGG